MTDTAQDPDDDKHPLWKSGRIYGSNGIMDGEYDIRVHLAGDEAVFCALHAEGDDEATFPGNIEYIENEMGLAEMEHFGQHVFERVLTPEPEREEDAPVVGKAVYDDGILQSVDFEFDDLEVDEEDLN